MKQDNKQENKNFWQQPVVVAVFAIFCTALWGSATPAIKIGYEILAVNSTDLGAKMVFAGLRFTLAGFLVLLFMGVKLKKIKLFEKRDILPYGIMGLVTTVQYICFYIGLTYTTGAKGSLFSSINGFIIVLISPLIYKSEKLNANKIVGCIVAVIGLVLITMDGGVQEFSGFTFMGEGMVIGCSFFHAVSFYLTKAFAKTRRAEVIAGWQLFLGGVVLLAIGSMIGGELAITSFSGGAV
ncbi:MAG: DMT family transporter, partial [Bacillota bacterium]